MLLKYNSLLNGLMDSWMNGWTDGLHLSRTREKNDNRCPGAEILYCFTILKDLNGMCIFKIKFMKMDITSSNIKDSKYFMFGV